MNTAIKTNRTEKKPAVTTRQGDKRIEAMPRCLKLGLDVHWTQYTVVAQFDGASPRPAQRFTPAGFLAWVASRRGQVDSKPKGSG
jgi:hypothetical protein